MVWSVLLVRWQAFDSLRQLSHAHGDVEPVEDRFAERAEVALRLAYAVAAVGQERRWPRREHALFSQESLHAFGGLGLQMDESKDSRLALRTGRVLNDGFASLGLDHEALYRAGHRFRFLEAQTDQIVGPPFDRSDVGGSCRSRGVLNDQLDPHPHIDSLHP